MTGQQRRPGAGERGGDLAEECSVILGEVSAVDVAAQHAKLMAQHDDFEVLRAPSNAPPDASMRTATDTEFGTWGFRHPQARNGSVS